MLTGMWHDTFTGCACGYSLMMNLLPLWSPGAKQIMREAATEVC